MSFEDHRTLTEKLGAHALGHVADDERVELEAHLESCPTCRAELEYVLPVAALLPKADPGRLEEPLEESLVVPPPSLDQRVYERVEQERWRGVRRRPASIGWVAAAAIVLVVLALATFFLAEERGEQVSLRPVAERTELPAALRDCEADATLEGELYSTQIELASSGLVPGQAYDVWLEKADGSRVSAGGFQAYDEGPITVHLSAALPPGEAVALGLGTPEGETGLRADLQGGVDSNLIVPDLRGRTLEDAIETAGPDFEVDAGRDDSGQPEETVVDQDPGPGERTQKGSKLSVTLSSDRQTSEDPDRSESDSSEAESLETENSEAETPETESTADESGSELDAETATDAVPASDTSSLSSVTSADEIAGRDDSAGNEAASGVAANVAVGPEPELTVVDAPEVEAGEASLAPSSITSGGYGNANEGFGPLGGPSPVVAQPGVSPTSDPSSPGTAPLLEAAPAEVAPLAEPLPEAAAPLPGDLLPSVAPLVPPTPLPEALPQVQQPVLPTLPALSPVPQIPTVPGVPTVSDSLQEPLQDTLPDQLRDPLPSIRPDVLQDPLNTPGRFLDKDNPTKRLPDIDDREKNNLPGVDLPKARLPGIGKGKKDRPRVDLPKTRVPDIVGRPKRPALPR